MESWIERVVLVSCVAILIVPLIAGADTSWAQNYREVRPAIDNDSVLFNPGMGFTMNGQDWYKENGVYKSFINIAYMRFGWAELEPEEGRYNFKVITDWASRWRKAGYRFAFGVYSTNVERTCTPQWVFDAGVPGPYHRKGKQRDPVYWHSLYIEKHKNFIDALGQYFDGMEGLEYVDIRGIGVWGEMHLGTFLDDMWTKDELAHYGFTIDKYSDAYRRIMDAYRSAFKKTTLFLNIGQYSDLTEYAVKKGIGLRYDGLTWKVKMNEMPMVLNSFNKYGYNVGKSHSSVKCHYEFAEPVSDPALLQKTLDIALSGPVSYIAPNPGDMNRVTPQNNIVIRKAGARIGYRFALRRLKVTDNAELSRNKGATILIEQEWINNGVAPCYRSYHLVYALTGHDGTTISEEKFVPNPSTMEWTPNTPIRMTSSITIPYRTKDGVYNLTVIMFDPDNLRSVVFLGIRGGDKKGHYTVSRIRVSSNKGRKSITVLSQ